MQALRLASYNIHKCVGPDGQRRPGRVLDVLNALGADVVAVQEADRRLGNRPATLPRRLIEAASDLRPIALSGSGRSLGWHGNALLVRRGFEPQAVLPLVLPGFEPRGALLVELLAATGLLRVVAVHLGLLRRDRVRQLWAIRRALAERAPMPTVILGDFNEWSATRGTEPLAGGFTLHAPGKSFHTLHPMGRLDRIGHCSAFHLRDAGAHDTTAARRASDHLPVWADLARAA